MFLAGRGTGASSRTSARRRRGAPSTALARSLRRSLPQYSTMVLGRPPPDAVTSTISSPCKTPSRCPRPSSNVTRRIAVVLRIESAAVDRLGLREEAQEDVLDDLVVLLLQGGMRDPGHHRELLVRIWQAREERDQVVEAGDAVV